MSEVEAAIAALDRETSKLSSPAAMRGVRSYRVIKSVGDDAVPALLDALEQERAVMPVMMLLGDITGTQPYPASARGNTAKMRAAWLAWGARTPPAAA